jgi:hypothetical protein
LGTFSAGSRKEGNDNEHVLGTILGHHVRDGFHNIRYTHALFDPSFRFWIIETVILFYLKKDSKCKEGAMIHYEDEFVFRGWTHGIGHVSGDIRTLRSHDTTVPLVTTHISWFPRDDDFNKHSHPIKGFQMRSAEPVRHFFRDKQLETGTRTVGLFNGDPTGFIPRGNQEVVQYRGYGQTTGALTTSVVTKPDAVYNIPGMHCKVKYQHQKHGQLIDPTDPLHPKADRYRDSSLKYLKVKADAASDKRLDDGETAFWGLNLVNMARWWQEFVRNPQNGYQFVSSSHNCTGVISSCLLEGGADAFVPPPSGLIYRKPNEVAAWIAELQKTLNLMNLRTLDFLSDLHQYINDPQVSIGHKNLINSAFSMHDVMPPLEFKNATSLRGELRRDRIKEIDSAIEDYYKTTSWAQKGAYTKKMRAMFTIAYNGIAYLQETAASRNSTHTRRAGVYALIASVLGQIERENSPLNIYLGGRFLSIEIDNATQIRLQHHDCALAPDEGIKAKNR